MAKPFSFTAKVCLFPQDNGWHYVPVPREFTATLKPLADRGLVAVRATVGSSTWDTSLLPMGDGTQFIPLPASVRRKEKIALDSAIKVVFTPR
ncbi:hypothetical protein CR970_04665 [Candidatus Saccharibacteria bacterium]|nr:MAG: hypothetical protein CR970_04665 [Candidatus Saccharibacteria bacterium]